MSTPPQEMKDSRFSSHSKLRCSADKLMSQLMQGSSSISRTLIRQAPLDRKRSLSSFPKAQSRVIAAST